MDLFVIVITVNLKPACNYGLVCNCDYCKPQTCLVIVDLFVIVITVNLKPASNCGLVCNCDYCKPQTCL